MNESNVYFLLKFGERKRLEQMLSKGILHMKRLRSFQNIEHAQIGDKNEGISHSWQPDKITVEINGKKLESLAGPVKITEDLDYNPHIFCMYGITTEHFNKNPGHYIDNRCLDFGDSVLVIVDGKEFKKRILETHKKLGGKITTGAVEYVSHDSHNGAMGAFKKFDYHSHQSEFRIVYQNNSTSDTIDYDIGNLKDIAVIYPSNEINKLISMQKKA